MFFLEGDQSILYTGDFCTKQKFFSQGAQPVNADVLIIESTFGSEEYIFPETKEVATQIRQCVASCIENDESVIVLAYPFGKAQELTHLLRDYVPFVDSSIYQINDALRSLGYDFRDQLFDAAAVTEAREPFVLITSGRSTPQGQDGPLRGKTLYSSSLRLGDGPRFQVLSRSRLRICIVRSRRFSRSLTLR